MKKKKLEKIEINFNTKRMKNWKKTRNVKLYNKTDQKSTKKKVKCKCPCCEKEHFMILEWKAKLPARKFCTKCLEYNNQFYTIDTISIKRL